MDQETFKVKSLELIHATKEFLQLKKAYEDGLAVLILIKKARMLGNDKLESLPKRVIIFVENGENLDDAEKKTLAKMSTLREKMTELTPEIRKLSDQLEPYLSGIKQPENNAATAP